MANASWRPRRWTKLNPIWSFGLMRASKVQMSRGERAWRGGIWEAVSPCQPVQKIECEMTSSHSAHLIKWSGGLQLGSADSLMKRMARGEIKSCTQAHTQTHTHTQNAELSRNMIQPLWLCMYIQQCTSSATLRRQNKHSFSLPSPHTHAFWPWVHERIPFLD